jgi:hypothetical protein
VNNICGNAPNRSVRLFRDSITNISVVSVHRSVRIFVSNSVWNSVGSCLGNSGDIFVTSPIRIVLSETVKEYNDEK